MAAMLFPEPPKPKSRVKAAGKKFFKGEEQPDDLEVIDQWRAAHGYVINTFQAWIKRHIKKKGKLYTIEFAQRLKRRKTVHDKLRRQNKNGDPLIHDVSEMHDFAGCRLIFNDIYDLQNFRDYMHSSAVTKNVEHELRHKKDPGKYDYIEHPKESGYRGIHDVYRHFPRGKERKEADKPWDGLLVEVQYRTRAQHAWATAVEISDLLDSQRTKFEVGFTERGRFFQIASELIARKHEGLARSCLDKSTPELQEELRTLESKLGIMQRLTLLKQFENSDNLKKHNVLSIYRDSDGQPQLEVIPFKSGKAASAKATELEQEENNINAVYVSADDPKQLRSAYRNYFYDPIDFVKLLKPD